MKLLNDKNDVRLRVRWGAGILLFLVVGSFIYSKVFTPMSEERAQTLLEKEFVPALLNGIAPVGYPIESGTSVALLEVKDIDLRRVVIEGTKAEELAKGPGHLVGSAIPGQPGTSAILGRSSTFGSAFDRIDELKNGQEIVITSIAELGLEGSSHSPMQLAIWLFLLMFLLTSLAPISQRIGTRVTWLLAVPLVLVVATQVWHNASLMYPGIG